MSALLLKYFIYICNNNKSKHFLEVNMHCLFLLSEEAQNKLTRKRRIQWILRHYLKNTKTNYWQM